MQKKIINREKFLNLSILFQACLTLIRQENSVNYTMNIKGVGLGDVKNL